MKRSMPGVTAYPSEANFVLFRTDRPHAEVFDGLLARGVLVRDMSAAVPGCLRVSAGTSRPPSASCPPVIATARL